MKSKIAALVACLLVAACGGGGSGPPIHTVQYSVGGTGSPITGATAMTAVVTYSDGAGGTTQTKVIAPWSTSLPITVAEGAFLYVSAQNQASVGSVSVTITINGLPFKSASSDAPFGIATASGSCC